MINKEEATYGPGRSTPPRVPQPVHDHGPDEGPGTACHEYLVGVCRVVAQKVYASKLRQAARKSVREMDRMQDRMQEAEAKVQAVRQYLYDQSPMGEYVDANNLKAIIDPGPAKVD